MPPRSIGVTQIPGVNHKLKMFGEDAPPSSVTGPRSNMWSHDTLDLIIGGYHISTCSFGCVAWLDRQSAVCIFEMFDHVFILMFFLPAWLPVELESLFIGQTRASKSGLFSTPKHFEIMIFQQRPSRDVNWPSPILPVNCHLPRDWWYLIF